MAHPVRFVSFEGIDSVGKTTHLARLRTELAAASVRAAFVSDPPKHAPWEALLDAFQTGGGIAKVANATLLLAARQDNYQRVIAPALRAGEHVLADRYADSWLAYQSVRLAEELGGEDVAFEYFMGLQRQNTDNGLIGLPDRTFYIADDPEVAMARSQSLGKSSVYERLSTQRRVARRYDTLAEQFPDRITRIEIAGRGEDAVYTELRSRVYEQLDI